jgi:tetratricopeptide (TPR) repeat protein
MAAYYWSLASSDLAAGSERMARAVRLSARTSDRERLRIRAGWALRYSAPELGAIAESLATRYPDEVEGHLYRGASLVMAQEYLAAVPHLRRAMRMDSLALRRTAPDGGARAAACAGCEARAHLVFAYHAADSLAAAEREARSWTRFAPASPAALIELASVLRGRGRQSEAVAALDSARRLDSPGSVAVQNAVAIHWIFVGDNARATELLRMRSDNGTPAEQADALWYLAIVDRERGRLADAVAAAKRFRALQRATEPAPPRGAASSSALIEAVMLDASGRHREAAALFDSLSRWRVPTLAPSHFARSRAWAMTHAANALAAAGDAGALPARADSIARYGMQSGYGRDQRLPHHVRGLALASRGDDAAAVEEFRASIRSPTVGYTRSNAELARALLRLHRPAEAVQSLQPALRGYVDGANLYVSRGELHELLARAWDAVFVASPTSSARDSAVVHYGAVVRAWREGDLPFRARAESAAVRIAALSTR